MHVLPKNRVSALLVAVLLCLVAGQSPLFAQTAEQKSRKAKLEREIAILDNQIRQTGKKSESALESLQLTRRKIRSRKALLAESDKQIADLDAQIAAKQDTIARLQERLDAMQLYYTRLVRTAYRNRDSRTWYLSLLSSSSMGQALRRYSYLHSLSGRMSGSAARIMATRDTIQAQKDRVEQLRQQAGQVRSERVSDLKKLGSEEAASAKLVNRLNKDKATYQKQLAQKRKQVEALNREMQRMVEKATGGAKKGSSKKKTEIDAALDARFANNKGRLPWPADGPVVDPFGERYHPVYKNVKMPFNNGINIALSPGTAVKCVFDGKVCQVVVMPGYNHCVLVQHGGYFTFYCKLENVAVKAGDKVSIGQVLGTASTISGETGIHFELWEDKTPLNPESWLK